MIECKQEDIMKLGILGTGKIVEEMLPMLVEQDVEKVYLFSTKRSEEKASMLVERYHLDGHFVDFKELLESDVDTIYIALPNSLHYAYAKEALLANKHVICEKPMTSTIEEARELARENDLKVANKPDSEDICFVPDGDYKKFLEINSGFKPKQGNIVNSKGEILGKHSGLYHYTIGQRKGLGIAHPTPLFVLGFNKEKNEVIVGEQSELFKKEIWVNEVNLLLMDEILEPIDVEVKTRYSQKAAKAKIVQVGEKIKVEFEEAQRALTPGQSAVFYIEDIVLGGGKIMPEKNRA